ncbi:MAG: PD40 domain-containing protein [Polyangiaceae bacterium]|nr:PD40 domain-containing protein [Polyangiaceae bacterium]
MARLVRAALVAGVVGAAVVGGVPGCTREERPAETTYYERNIAPILQESCASSPTTSGCHVADSRGNALGNLSVASYGDLSLRRDLFQNYGPYGMPALLLEVVPEYDLRLVTYDNEVVVTRSNIVHAGGSLLDFGSVSLATLQRWIERGAAENNAAAPPPKLASRPCSETLGTDALFDPSADPAGADFAAFRDRAGPVLVKSCAAGNCHGARANSLYLTCGSTPEQVRWNYFAASDFVNADTTASELLRSGLDPASGGAYHEGGVFFPSTSDPDWLALRDWAAAKGPPTNVPAEEGFPFFAKRVQPMLARRGCMTLACHSGLSFHEYRLRGGSGGHFGLAASRTNYHLSLEQIALETTDPNASRIVRKNLPPDAGGILHRGGPLLAYGGDPTACDPVAAETAPLDEVSEYCVLVTWIAKERAARMPAAGLSHLVFVRRPPAPGRNAAQDFESYAPGADLIRAPATVDAAGVVTLGAEESLLAGCGLDPATADVRRPAVAWDGSRLGFSARTAADQPWRVYVLDAAGCGVEPTIDAPPVDDEGNPVPSNGELVHNFDPAFSPDGRVVFTSTRGNVMNVGAFSYQGPQRTPADPSKLNSNLYIAENGHVRQLTFLLNQELYPMFKSDGRVIFSTEKRAPGFYQLAGRRINIDGGDYHPLFGQRATAGYLQFTEFVETADKNLVAIASDRGTANQAGALVVINRSIGVDQKSADPADYPLDPSAIDRPAPGFYQSSLRVIDPASTGRLGGTQGAYRSPYPLPDGRLVVSYAPNVVELSAFSGNFDIHVVDPVTGRRTPLVEGPSDELWPVAVYPRMNRGVFDSSKHEANVATNISTAPDRKPIARIRYVDLPMLMGLLFQNTRSPRQIDASSPEFWESLPPAPGVTSFAQGGSFVTTDQYGEVYARRRSLGVIQLFQDGSGIAEVPGGMPLVMALDTKFADDTGPRRHFLREELQFYPGEELKQGFRRQLFDGMCAGCHGSISGQEKHVVVNPDILTQASEVIARTAEYPGLIGGGAERGPPFD